MIVEVGPGMVGLLSLGMSRSCRWIDDSPEAAPRSSAIVEVGPHELGRERRDDRVAVGAYAAHSAGNPINHRLNSGFKKTPGTVGALHDPCARPKRTAASGSVMPS